MWIDTEGKDGGNSLILGAGFPPLGSTVLGGSTGCSSHHDRYQSQYHHDRTVGILYIPSFLSTRYHFHSDQSAICHQAQHTTLQLPYVVSLELLHQETR